MRAIRPGEEWLGNWSAPFSPWVARSWAEYSRLGGFKKIADEIRRNILNKAVEHSSPMKHTKD